jgi:hypothetical protein
VPLDLPDAERQELDAYDRARGGRTFERMLGMWNQIATEINEVDWNVDDFTGVLCLWRDPLEDAVRDAPSTLSARLREEVERVDEQFRANTEPDDNEIVSVFFRVGDRWWLRRNPRRGPLREYLDAANARRHRP